MVNQTQLGEVLLANNWHLSFLWLSVFEGMLWVSFAKDGNKSQSLPSQWRQAPCGVLEFTSQTQNPAKMRCWVPSRGLSLVTVEEHCRVSPRVVLPCAQQLGCKQWRAHTSSGGVWVQFQFMQALSPFSSLLRDLKLPVPEQISFRFQTNLLPVSTNRGGFFCSSFGVLQGKVRNVVFPAEEDQMCAWTKCRRCVFSVVHRSVPLTENRIRRFPEAVPWGQSQLPPLPWLKHPFSGSLPSCPSLPKHFHRILWHIQKPAPHNRCNLISFCC